MCEQTKRAKRRIKAACCEWQANLLTNGWLEQSESWRSFWQFMVRTNPHLCRGA